MVGTGIISGKGSVGIKFDLLPMTAARAFCHGPHVETCYHVFQRTEVSRVCPGCETVPSVRFGPVHVSFYKNTLQVS